MEQERLENLDETLMLYKVTGVCLIHKLICIWIFIFVNHLHVGAILEGIVKICKNQALIVDLITSVLRLLRSLSIESGYL